ncbi:MAG: alpha/beta hydrolase [Nitrospinae bacterium]|nr:alpha/beta hydrolase [Nitrospinota bacterium]
MGARGGVGAAVLGFAFLSIAACSGVFYQPGKVRKTDPADLGMEYQDVRIESAGGRKLHAWLFPSGNGAEERGTIIQFHGNAENISTHFLSLSWVTKHGYNFITFDYSGYWDSDGAPGQRTLNEDALAALKYAVEFNGARAAETGTRPVLAAYGQSLGGTVLMRALADFSERRVVDAVIIESAFPSYQDIAREKLSILWETWLFQPLAYLLVSDAYAPEKTIASLSGTRILVIHGTEDNTVPIHHGRRIFELAGKPKDFWEVQGGRHIDSMVGHDGKYRRMLIEYLGGPTKK